MRDMCERVELMSFSWLEKVIVEKAVNEGCERVGGLVG